MLLDHAPVQRYRSLLVLERARAMAELLETGSITERMRILNELLVRAAVGAEAVEIVLNTGAVTFAQQVVTSRGAHMGDPANDLKKTLRRFDYVLEKFGITFKQLGVTAHGLRHEVLIDRYEAPTGQVPPVRGGPALPEEVDRSARQAVTKLAGHPRTRASGAYLGAVLGKRKASEGRVPIDCDPLPTRPDEDQETGSASP